LIEEALVNYLMEEYKCESKMNEEKYKMKFTINMKDQSGSELVTSICVRILAVNEDLVCVEFVKISGNQFTFMDHFNEIKTSLNQFNDAIPA